MEKKLKNMRRIPLNDQFLQKRTNDNLYAYLLVISSFDPETKTRYVDKDRLTVSEILYNVNGVNNKMKYYRDLERLELLELIYSKIIKDSFGKTIDVYVINQKPLIKGELYSLIPRETLDYMSYALNVNSIKIYAYLLSKYNFFNVELNTPYNFSINSIITDCLKLSSTSNPRDRRAIKYILESLEMSGLIEISEYVYVGKSTVNPIHKLQLNEINLYTNKEIERKNYEKIYPKKRTE